MTDKLPHEPTMEERIEAALTALEFGQEIDAILILKRALQVLRGLEQ